MFLYLRFEFFIILIHHSSILIILLLRIASGRDPLCLMLFWTLSRTTTHTIRTAEIYLLELWLPAGGTITNTNSFIFNRCPNPSRLNRRRRHFQNLGSRSSPQ